MRRSNVSAMVADVAASANDVHATLSVKAAIEQGERALLDTLRAKIAAELDGGVPAHTLAGLSRQLRELDSAVREIDSRDLQGTVGDDGDGHEAWSAQAV